MPVPNATGTQGSRRPAPASARAHARSVSINGGQKAGRDGTKPPDRRRRARRPGPGIAPLPARSVALLRHAGYTLRSRGERKTTGRCIAAASGTDAETGRNAHRPALHLGHSQESDEGQTSHEACSLHFDCAHNIRSAVSAGCGRTMPFHRGEVRARGVLSAPGDCARRPAEGPGNATGRTAKALRADAAGRCPAREIHARHLPGLLGGRRQPPREPTIQSRQPTARKALLQVRRSRMHTGFA